MIKNVLVIGGGSIGSRHIRNLLRIKPTVEIGVCDPGLSHSPVEQEGVSLVSNKEAGRWDAALVCSPTHLHYEHMSWAISRNIPCLVEKPICLPNQVGRARDDLLASWSDSLPVMVGYNLYFHPWFEEVRRAVTSGQLGEVNFYLGRYGHYLPYWRGQRDSYSRHRHQGGGVLLDCIQDIDLMLELGGPWGEDFKASVACDVVGNVTQDSEDTALIQVSNGPPTSARKMGILGLDYLSHRRIRSMQITGSLGTLLWTSERYAPSGEPGLETLTVYQEDGIRLEKQGSPPDLLGASYMSEMRAFLQWVEHGVAPTHGPNPFRALDFLQKEVRLW